MNAGDFIIEHFRIASPLDSVASLRDAIISGEPVVIMNRSVYCGILSLKDIARSPCGMVAEALTSKTELHASLGIQDALRLILQHNEEFLPVMNQQQFIGVVSRATLFEAYRKESRTPVDTADTGTSGENITIGSDKVLPVLAHDMKNLFHQVNGSIELLCRKLAGLPDERTRVLMELTRQSANRIHDTFEELLLWARHHSGVWSVKKELISVSEIAMLVARDFELQSGMKEIKVELRIDEGLHLSADRNMLRCMLTNLLHNALKYTARGGSIFLIAVPTTAGLDLVTEDSGAYRQPESDSDLKEDDVAPDYLSSGLGLLICREFALYHGATLTLERQEGCGARAILSFPWEH
jgi:signal transduction histidine kinase